MDDQNSCTLSEVILISGVCAVITILGTILYVNMRGDWTADPENRTRVLVVAIILFCLNILICCYMTKRLGIRICRPHIDRVSQFGTYLNTFLLS